MSESLALRRMLATYFGVSMRSSFGIQDRHFNGGFGVVSLYALVDTRRGLEGALEIAFAAHSRATHYRIVENSRTGGNSLVLLWSASEGSQPLPFTLDDAARAVDFVASWLAEKGQWPKQQPDTGDGMHRGFRIQTDSSEWGYVVVSITCEWTVYGK